ncbi:integral membrane transport protein [Streptomyces sp. NPDC052301]|uniref:integral membrane transport protein n=1 Tax=Streptomyces sp. NPDC052301 TaxID=3365687 RepID=UPI0037D787FA
MSAVTEAVRVAPPGNPVIRSVRDSMVVAKRNLIRMSRCRSGSISPRIQDRRPNALKEQVK